MNVTNREKVLHIPERKTLPLRGDVQVCLDLLLCDRYDHEVIFTVCANVNIAGTVRRYP